MIRGIHYFSTELKTKIDVIPRSCFNLYENTGTLDLQTFCLKLNKYDIFTHLGVSKTGIEMVTVQSRKSVLLWPLIWEYPQIYIELWGGGGG